MKAHTRTVWMAPLMIASAAGLWLAGEHASAQGTAKKDSPNGISTSGIGEPRGLRTKKAGASPGYVLFSPLLTNTTYLIDADGRVVRTWNSELVPSAWLYLLDNGHLLRGGREPETKGFSGGGQGGRFQEFTWDGELVWDFSFNSAEHLPHHDVAVLPNGNLLAVAWEYKSVEEARAAGRREGFISERGLWPDKVIEFEPQPPTGARIVWEWHSWDHMIQNVNRSASNYGEPAEHPEKIDLNGDLLGETEPPQNISAEIIHTNAIAYNAALDQIILSAPRFNELWVIDHSTTAEEAAGSAGGRSGKGGDLLYRWGNPRVYGRGGPEDELFGFQHDTRWIEEGLPGAGHMMIFSNRTPGANGPYSKVYEIVPPVDGEGRYRMPADGPFGPAEPAWSYSAPDSFWGSYISGAHRLANGNTLITSGPQGRFFEVTPAGEIVWEYWSPYWGVQGGGPNGAGNPYSVFRATKIPPDHPALAGKDLKPLDPQPEIRPFPSRE